MKLFTMFLTLSLISFPSFKMLAENDLVLSTFENYDPTSSAYTTWTSSSNVTVTAVDNPYKTGLNTSGKVLKVVANGAANWEGLYSGGAPLSLKISSNPSAGYRYFHCKIYKSEGSNFLVTLKNSAGDEKMPMEQWVPSVVNQWDTVVVDMLNNTAQSYGVQDGDTYNIVTIQPSKVGATSYTFYLDDIYFSNNPISKSGTISLPTGLINTVLKQQVNVTRVNNSTVKIFATPEADCTLSLKIFDMQGRLLWSMADVTNDSYEVNLPNNAIYILQASDKHGNYSVKF